METRPWAVRLRRAAAHPAFVSFFLVGVTFGAFWPVLHSGFIEYDDPEYVSANPQVLAGLTWKGLLWAFHSGYASNWHPLTWLSHMADINLFGPGPTGPHLVNLSFHAGSAVLLFLLLRAMTGTHWRSAFVAALFALHPLHVESVAWVSERKDVLSAFLFLLTLWAYVKYAQKQSRFERRESRAGTADSAFNSQPSGDHLTSSIFYLLSLFCFALGLMSKPMLVTLPFLLLLLDYWPLGRFGLPGSERSGTPKLRLLTEKVPFLVLSGITCAATLWAQGQAIQPLENLPLGERIGNAVVSYVRYLLKMVCPANLAVPYPHPGRWPAWVVVLCAALMAVAFFIAWRARRRFPFVLTGWLWYWGMLIPVIGLVQVGNQSMADRYTYLPLVGMFIIVAWGMAEMTGRCSKVILGGCAVLVLAACAVMTHRQAGYWRDDQTLFGHAIRVTSRNYVALTNLGVSLWRHGREEEALACYRQALEISPRFVDAMNNLGVLLADRGGAEGLLWYRKALEIKPGNPAVLFNMANEFTRRKEYAQAAACLETVVRSKPWHYQTLNNLGSALKELGRTDEAIAQYRLARKVAPGNLQIVRNLASALVTRGDAAEAVALYQEALDNDPNDASVHYGLGLALALQGRWDEAIAHYQETLRLAPTNPEAWYNLGYAFRVRERFLEAETHLEQALRLKPEFPLAHYNLGCALAQQGRRNEAVAHLREALRLRPDYTDAKEKLGELMR